MEVIFIDNKVRESGDIVNCLATDEPNRAISITHYSDGTVVPNCEFLRCIFFDRCKLSENPFIKHYIETTDAKSRGF